MIKETNKSTTILLLVIAGALLFLVGSFTGNLTVGATRLQGQTCNTFYKCASGLQCINSRCQIIPTPTSCVWVDRYSNLDLDHTPLSSVCSTAKLIGYTPIAYELRRDYWTYQDNSCTKLVTQSSDHQILKNTEKQGNFGENVGNLDKCFNLAENKGQTGLNYMTIFQMYDGALCCK